MKAILVVDDDCTLRSGIKGVIAYLFPAIEVLEAENGRDGLAIAQTRLPDVILLDGNMPVMNGYETAKILKKHPLTRQTPLIAISGGNPHDPAIYGLWQLCDAWLPKPFTSADLRLLVGSCISF